MTAEHITLPGIGDNDQAILNHLLDDLAARKRRNLLRLSYYDSKRAIRQVGSVVPPQYRQLGLVLGWCGKGVDSLARRCNLDGFTWADGDLDSLGGKALWDDNNLGAETNWGITSSLKFGPAFLVNTIGGSDEPDSLIHVKSALNATGDWNTRRRSLDNLLSITDRDKNSKITGLALYLDGRTITAEKDGGAWSTEVQEHAYGVPAEMLAYRADEDRPLGRSRITRAAMGYQDAGTRALIRLEGHMDIYSYPEYWMLGADLSAFKNADGTQKSVWEVRMGRIKGIPDDQDAPDALARADVKQFAASDPTPHLADINALSKLTAREFSLPDSAVAITDVSNPTSAEAYDASQYELIAEAEGAVDDWSPALRKSYVRGLAIANRIPVRDVPAEWASIAPRWRDPRYQSRAAQADAGMKQLAAIPWLADTEVGLELLGLDQQQIDRALADKRRSGGSAVLQQLLNARGSSADNSPAA